MNELLNHLIEKDFPVDSLMKEVSLSSNELYHRLKSFNVSSLNSKRKKTRNNAESFLEVAKLLIVKFVVHKDENAHKLFSAYPVKTDTKFNDTYNGLCRYMSLNEKYEKYSVLTEERRKYLDEHIKLLQTNQKQNQLLIDIEELNIKSARSMCQSIEEELNRLNEISGIKLFFLKLISLGKFSRSLNIEKLEKEKKIKKLNKEIDASNCKILDLKLDIQTSIETLDYASKGLDELNKESSNILKKMSEIKEKLHLDNL